MTQQRPPSNTAVILRIVSDIEKKLDDFEQRIRALEKAHWSNAVMQSILTAGITGAVVAVIVRAI
jgi:endonuclease V-like protein UPF0215 family